MTTTEKMKAERHEWLCEYVTANPRKGVQGVVDAAEYHKGWIVDKVEIRAARVAVGLQAKVCKTKIRRRKAYNPS